LSLAVTEGRKANLRRQTNIKLKFKSSDIKRMIPMNARAAHDSTMTAWIPQILV
jgi:hypothetical protein